MIAQSGYQLLRVDTTQSFRLDCQNDVAAWLHAATPHC
ncbi:phage/plasmid replication domain-containing protein [Candidatus Reidiella endopervernicosa]